MISGVFLSIWFKQNFCEIGKTMATKIKLIKHSERINLKVGYECLSNEFRMEFLDILDDLYWSTFQNQKVKFTFLYIFIFFSLP